MPRHEQIEVSDHALVRWLERVHGVDVEFFRGEIREAVEGAMELGATALTRPEAVYVLEPSRHRVVTVLAPGMLKAQRNRPKRSWRTRPRFVSREDEHALV